MSETTEFKFSPLQEKWLQALESGEWKQTTGSLRGPDDCSFCCLGVAAELMELDRDEDGCYRLGGSQIHAILDCGLHERLGLRTDNGSFMKGYQLNKCFGLTAANDGGATFAEIAAFIRANPMAVFVEPSPCSPQ